MTTLGTQVYLYCFDIKQESERHAWEALSVKLKKENGQCFNVLAGQSADEFKPEDGQVVELETVHIFSNQWNTACGHRVFDWYEGIYPAKNIKKGYYLRVTDAMREIRRNTNACGYCGHQEAAQKGLVFCDKCLGSSYLEEKNLPLLRMVNFEHEGAFAERGKLTTAELDHLMPLYLEGQTRNRRRQVEKTRAAITAKYEKKLGAVQDEYHGMKWLLDNGVNTENCIFYSHTGRFCFGWRAPVSNLVYSKLIDVLCEFPFDYDIKSEEDHSRV